jgi:hypothetical protein
MSDKLEKYYFAKKKNVRIYISIYKSDKSDHHSIVIQTRRLNSFKDRRIAESSVVYSIDTLFAMSAMLDHLFNSSYSNKNLHWQIPKEKFNVSTNVE